MHHDDTPRGHLLSRREVLELLGIACLTGNMLGTSQAHAATNLCIVRPEQGEGPYFTDGDLNRYDIRSDPTNGQMSPGVPLELIFHVSQLQQGDCQPLADAQVDIWHCDAQGVYSDVQGRGLATQGKKFLRGYQISNQNGEARFLTIYPGWYQNRAVHIHLKIRTGSGQGLEFTSQLYFDDALTDHVYTADPYAARGQRKSLNKDDRLYKRNGDQLMLSPVQSGEGYSAAFEIGLQLS